ncbi:Mitochondrial intermembrane space import and assembly protein 40 [Leucoagaricus sp. SymC.cos]|nr:Mitochondrial intermembrane space import and assembly protein 40 [Leucoagaricus sp. SymC.cos]
MFARLTRLPLRRCLHIQAARPQPTRFARAALGVSAVTATLFTWRLLSDPIALDSHATTSSLQKPTVSSKPPSKATVASSPSDSTPETSSVPNSEPSSERSTSSQPTKKDKDSTSKPDGGEEQSEGEGDSKGASGGAFNPETGEINWDCPCLGGMAHGPCGPEFREAFSCFVFSEQEPKGIDCVEKFKAMQDCFRRHPEVYSDEIMDDDEEEAAAVAGSPEVAAVTTETNGRASTSDAPSIPQDTPTSSTSSS